MAGHSWSASDRDDGFSLVEVLVVMVILGILASIAFVTFIRQKTKAQEAAAESALRNAATSQESYFREFEGYAPAQPLLTGQGYTASDAVDTLTINLSPDGSAYAMCAQHSGGGRAMLVRGNDGRSQSPAVRLSGRMPDVACPAA